MTEPVNRYDEEMRRALSAAVDPVVPAGDGLDRIRERVVHRPLPYAWLLAWAGWLPARLGASLRVAASAIAVAVADTWASLAEPAPGGGTRPRNGSAWLRPTVAAVGALAIVAIGAAVVLPRLHQSVQPSSYSGGGGPGTSIGASVPVGTSGASTADGTATPVPSRRATRTWQSPFSQRPFIPPPTCPPSPSPSTSNPTPTPTGQGSIGPTPAPNPTETADPGPSPTGTLTPPTLTGGAFRDLSVQPAPVAGAADCTEPGGSSPAPTTQPTGEGNPTPTPSDSTSPTGSPSPTSPSPTGGTPSPTGESSASPTAPAPAPPPPGS